MSEVTDFVERYANDSGMTVREFYDHFVPMPDATSPHGFAAVSNRPLAIKGHTELYWPEDAALKDL